MDEVMQSASTGKKITLFAVFVSCVFLFGCSSSPEEIQPIESQETTTTLDSSSSESSDLQVENSEQQPDNDTTQVGTDVYECMHKLNWPGLFQSHDNARKLSHGPAAKQLRRLCLR